MRFHPPVVPAYHLYVIRDQRHRLARVPTSPGRFIFGRRMWVLLIWRRKPCCLFKGKSQLPGLKNWRARAILTSYWPVWQKASLTWRSDELLATACLISLKSPRKRLWLLSFQTSIWRRTGSYNFPTSISFRGHFHTNTASCSQPSLRPVLFFWQVV